MYFGKKNVNIFLTARSNGNANSCFRPKMYGLKDGLSLKIKK